MTHPPQRSTLFPYTTLFRSDVASNIHLICDHFNTFHPGYLIPCRRKTITGADMFFINDKGYFRVFPFINNSHTTDVVRSEEHTSELQSQSNLVCRLLFEKKN